MKNSFFRSVIIFSILFGLVLSGCWEENQKNHKILDLKENEGIFNHIAYDLEDGLMDLMSLVEEFLQVRPPASLGNQLVRNFVRLFFNEGLGWEVVTDSWTQTTLWPYFDNITFNNIIATQSPHKPRQLVLACHYDSKTFPIGFLGATDSAVPCAIAMHVALILDKLIRTRSEYSELSLQVIMFDGEEQLYNNTMFGPDGLYGSRHMAQRLSGTPYDLFISPISEPWCQSGQATSLSRIDLMVLLDLVGAPFPTFMTYLDPITGECDEYGSELSRIEDKLIENTGQQKLFSEECEKLDSIVDDHTPLMELGLRRTLHVISDPFPDTWHTMEDDMEHLDISAIQRVNRVIRIFVAEYFNLSFDAENMTL